MKKQCGQALIRMTENIQGPLRKSAKTVDNKVSFIAGDPSRVHIPSPPAI